MNETKGAYLARIRMKCADILAAAQDIALQLSHLDASDECYERDKDIIRAVFALKRAIGGDNE